MATRAAGGGLKALEDQRTKPEKRLGKKRGWDTMSPRPILRTRDCQNQAD